MIDNLTDGKSKVKEILKRPSNSLNEFPNECLFGFYFENELFPVRILK